MSIVSCIVKRLAERSYVEPKDDMDPYADQDNIVVRFTDAISIVSEEISKSKIGYCDLCRSKSCKNCTRDRGSSLCLHCEQKDNWISNHRYCHNCGNIMRLE